jgi:hypothetical protein
MESWGDIDLSDVNHGNNSEENSISLKKSADSDKSSSSDASHEADESTHMESSDLGEDISPKYHQTKPEKTSEDAKQKERDFRKRLNQTAREVVSKSIHKGVKLIVHRPDYLLENQQEYISLSKELMPIVGEIARKTLPLLQHEISSEFARNHYYGSKFQADSVAYGDFRYFSKKRPPTESPALVVGLRVDESASMSAFGRIEAAKRAVIAVYEILSNL